MLKHLLLAISLVAGFGTAAEASPVTYSLEYTVECTEGCSERVPSFTLSFELPDYVTTSALSSLPAPFAFDTGIATATPQTVTTVGTTETGTWLFGAGNDYLTAADFTCNWTDGPCFWFEPDTPLAAYITAPVVLTGDVLGLTDAYPDVGTTQYAINGTGVFTVSVPDAAVPEPATLLLLGSGLAGLGAAIWRHRRG